ncbi:polysaccharide deacetylase [Flavobacterium saliperosum S13]|uniref:Peptidoglycan/xylan/chitin deacetylase, PgdA/CDA1 family n=2 Tax=Flavobacterium saliperosum TaxID=329186 RepID=A0A1G4V7Q3_9FLAO|nr:polysaccharide deacetylase family protein [Flavobacterium saliperosum]ESU28015.1 polysaccharide deacetylase [Flavobacterium saliperosum S13]SCX02564.1 Peptidoglycan/xylan/chitin deacetylase, PgdA/CDA1 family [Flavobacterium saliperosum]
MDFYWIKTNKLIKRLFSNQVWDIPNAEKKIYLTFDDGPTPEVTEWVLSVLKQHDIKATFFCIGDNIRKHPELFQKVISEGHHIGNHTYNHLQGWKTSDKAYLENINSCEDVIRKKMTDDRHQSANCGLFRPPYGKIRPSQSARLRKKGYKIIMWDVLSADFDLRITPEKCLSNVIKNTTQGSIIVFHDSRKAFKNLEYTLPRTIEILKEKGFLFDTID